MSSFSFLLVDDEKEFIEAITLRLRQRGFTADCVFSGQEALNRIEGDNTVDIVVLDVGMPYPDGINTLKTIKREHPLIEVIMLTGHVTIHSAVEAMKSGAFDYLTKPCALNELIFKAEQAITRKKERQAKILDVRMKPYISAEERDELISQILDIKE
jgi:DNA-binding NtrC family response regulator